MTGNADDPRPDTPDDLRTTGRPQLTLLATPAQVKRRIGDRILAPPGRLPMASATVGTVTLHPHQREAVDQARAALQHHGGVLLADDVGMGKTYVALALAADYDAMHVIAPATLLPMWREALRRTAARNVILHSVHRVSQRQDALTCVPASTRVLVVVDEAHHLRTSGTLRYTRVAQFVTGHHVLLMTATPLHNRTRELRSLFALFLGSRADLLDEAMRERLIVRRTHQDIPHHGVPAVTERPAIPVPFDRATLSGILKLPDPLPARGGSTAGALIRIGLLRAWCSSDAALAHSIRVRRLRGEALAHALRHGRHPTHDELRTWVIADDAVQLAFTELVVEQETDTAPMLRVMERHLDALATLQVHHAASGQADATRAAVLRTLLEEAPERPVVAFSQFRETVRALFRALADIAGVAAVSGRSARIASGSITRAEVLQRFAPRAHGRPPPAPHQRVRLLLSTDMLAEGVNLQDAGTVVHLDLPWTDALRRQRVGRCARIGAAFDPILVITLEPPPGIEAELRIMRRLARKAGLAREFVGASEPDERQRRSIPEQVSRIRSIMATWRTPGVNRPRNTVSDTPTIAFVRGAFSGWLAVIETDHGARLVARHANRTSDAHAHVLALLESVGDIRARPTPHAMRQVRNEVARQLRQWINSRQVQEVIGPGGRTVSPLQRAALARVSALLASESPALRSRMQASAVLAEQVIRAACGVGAELGLRQWLQSRAPDWLDGWKEVAPLRQVGLAIARTSPISANATWRMSALLVTTT